MKTALLLLLFLVPNSWLTACTIVSGTDRKGQTWAMNNEDFFHTSSNYVNVFPAKDNHTLGYLTLTYGSAESSVQGGVNEAGLFFDVNALPPPQNYKLSVGKKPFPHGNMLEYLLQHCKSVPEFLALWDTYYLPELGDQIHLADKYGNLAVIAPDTILRATKHLTSTNFNVCDTGPQQQRCWRYPLAQQVLAADGVSQASLVKIAAATSQRKFMTSVYTNIHNLSTGEIWFYLAEEYQTPWHTSVPILLKQGHQHILLKSKFPHNASRRLATVLKTQGTAQAVERFLQAGSFSASQKESQLRLAFLNAFFIDKDFANATLLFPLWEQYMYTNKRLDRTEVGFTKAEVLAVNGQTKAAIQVLEALPKPSWKTTALLTNLKDTEDANAVIALTGYRGVKAVVVETKGDYSFFRFMHKTPTGWRLGLKSNREELTYCFYIAGKRVVNPAQPIVKHQETAKGDFASFNTLKLAGGKTRE